MAPTTKESPEWVAHGKTPTNLNSECEVYLFIFCGLVPGTIILVSISRKISLVETTICGFVISQSLIAVELAFSRIINVSSGRYVPLLISGLLLQKAKI